MNCFDKLIVETFDNSITKYMFGGVKKQKQSVRFDTSQDKPKDTTKNMKMDIIEHTRGTTTHKEKNNNAITNTNETSTTKSSTSTLHDMLFWYLYAISHNMEYSSSFYNKHMFETEKKWKYELVEKMNAIVKYIETNKLKKKNKEDLDVDVEKDYIISRLKKFKIKIENLIVDLANDNFISLDTAISIVIMNKLHVCFVHKKTVMFVNAFDYNPMYNVLEIRNNALSGKERFQLFRDKDNLMFEIKQKYHTVDDLRKKLKSIGSYKVFELVDILEKMGYNMNQVYAFYKKGKTNKQELYDFIIKKMNE